MLSWALKKFNNLGASHGCLFEESLCPYLPIVRTAKTGHTGRIPKADLYFHWAYI